MTLGIMTVLLSDPVLVLNILKFQVSCISNAVQFALRMKFQLFQPL